MEKLAPEDKEKMERFSGLLDGQTRGKRGSSPQPLLVQQFPKNTTGYFFYNMGVFDHSTYIRTTA